MGRRFLGSRFGDAVPVSASSVTSAVYPMSDQYYIKQEGGWAVSKATGGTVTVPGDGYVYHQFYANVPGVAPGAAAGASGPEPRAHHQRGGGGARDARRREPSGHTEADPAARRQERASLQESIRLE